MFSEKSTATSILRVVLTLVLLCAGAAHAQEPAMPYKLDKLPEALIA